MAVERKNSTIHSRVHFHFGKLTPRSQQDTTQRYPILSRLAYKPSRVCPLGSLHRSQEPPVGFRIRKWIKERTIIKIGRESHSVHTNTKKMHKTRRCQEKHYHTALKIQYQQPSPSTSSTVLVDTPPHRAFPIITLLPNSAHSVLGRGLKLSRFALDAFFSTEEPAPAILVLNFFNELCPPATPADTLRIPVFP